MVRKKTALEILEYIVLAALLVALLYPAIVMLLQAAAGKLAEIAAQL